MAAPAIAAATAEVSKTKWGQVALGVAVIGGTVVAVIVTVKVLQALQILDTREERRAGRQAGRLNKSEAIDPNYYMKRPQKVTITVAQAEQYATTIYNAKGYIYDDEDRLYGAFRSAGSKWNLSFIAAVFAKKYNNDMLGYIETYTNEEQRAKLLKIINEY